MDFLDYDVQGEILLPLKHTKTESMKYEEISNTSYLNYRNILLQGELIHFYVILKIQGLSQNESLKILNSLHFKIDFQSTLSSGKSDSTQNDIALKEEEYSKTLSDLFTMNSEKINLQNNENENIINKLYDEKSNVMVYEVFKQIIAPNSLIDNNILLQLNLLIKNEESTYNDDVNALDFYQNEYFNTIDKYKTIKTLFKEVKIVRPLKLSNLRQFDLKLESALLQAKIENKTMNLDLLDKSLKHSKFLRQATNEEIEQYIKENNRGINMTIKEVHILKEETTVDELLTKNIKQIKEIYMQNGKITLNNFDFSLFNTHMPESLHPGEEYNLSILINKSVYLNEKNRKQTTIEIHSDDANNQNENKDNVNQNENLLNQNVENHNLNKLKSFSFFGMKNKNIDEIMNPVTIRDDTTEINLDFFKIYFTTPVILNITSDYFYENLYMCIQLKWSNEINRFLKMEIITPKEIYSHKYFEISMKCRNISSKEMNLLIEIHDDTKNENLNDFLIKNTDSVPSIIPQTKYQDCGIFNCYEDKIFSLRFLPLKSGFVNLPRFVLVDTLSNKRFFIMHNHKLYVKDNTTTIKEEKKENE